ncbi:MAG: D-2-hydroxyacid dehydrogenase [Acidimicrobiia bacterium]
MAESTQPLVVLHPLHGPGLDDALRQLANLYLSTPDEEAEMAAELGRGAAGLITYRWEDSYLVPGLRWVQAISAGYDQFPLDALRSNGVVLTSARGAHSPAVADHALALLLALLRGLGPALRNSRHHDWRIGRAYETEGITVGVVGLGSIGEAVARRVLALGMEVIGCKRRPDAYAGVVPQVVGPEGLVSLFRGSDAVILTLPQTRQTEGLIGARHLAALGGGWLVNVGRGSVLDEEALLAALQEGTVAGAGLDVTAEEPLPGDSPLWDHPRVIITPHMAWVSDRLTPRLVEIIEANADALIGEGQWINQVL